jgi:hypothetical protein
MVILGSKSRRVSSGVMALMLAVVQVLSAAQAASAWTIDPTENPGANHKSLVCKLVGTPGSNEVLQTGDNPLSLDRKDGDQIGTLFNDAQGGSYVMGFAKPGEKPEPTVADCYAMAAPSVKVSAPCANPGSTSTVSVTVTNNDQIIGNSVVYTVTVGAVSKKSQALSDGASQSLTFDGLAIGSHSLSVSALGGVVYTSTVVVPQCEQPSLTEIDLPVVAIDDPCGSNNAVYLAVPSGQYTVVRHGDGSITLTANSNYVFKVVDGYTYSANNTVVTMPAPVEQNTQSCAAANLVINKHDQNGNQLAGAEFGGISCERANIQQEFSCIDLTNYDWFSQGITDDGTTADNYNANMPLKIAGTTCADSLQTVTIWEKSGPSGYDLQSGRLTACLTKNGWIAGDNTIGANGTVVATPDLTTMNIINHRIAVRNDAPLVKKVDQDGKPLTGMVFDGSSCSRQSNEADWQCQGFHNYSWSNMANVSVTNGLTQDIHILPTLATSCEDTNQFLVLIEKQAPIDYQKAEGAIVLCSTVNGWVVATNLGDDAINAEVLNQDGRIRYDTASNTVVFVNNRIGRGGGGPSTPTPITPVVAKTTETVVADELPHTGPTEVRSINYLLIGLVASIVVYGAIYFAQPRRTN